VKREERPNVIVIMTDEHAPQFSSVYGNMGITTPNLNRLASNGITFENAYCPAPLCVPSRMSFMTGLYPHKNDIFDNGCSLPSDQITWAHIFRQNGYDVVLDGRMHFIGKDQMHGFSSRPVPERSHTNMTLEHSYDDGLIDSQSENRIRESGEGDSVVVNYDRKVTAAAKDFLKERSRDKSNNPFALCIGYIAPHFPLICPHEFFSLYYPDRVSPPQIPIQPPEKIHQVDTMLRHYFSLNREYSEEEILKARAAYYGLVTFIDDEIGKVLDEVKANGFNQNTIIVYVSDHGEMLGEHGLWWKCSFYEHSVRIPFILSLPGGHQKDIRIKENVSLLDCMPTLFELCGLSDIPTGDGESLVSHIYNSANKRNKPVLSEYLGHGIIEPTRMLRFKNYKYIYVHNHSSQLFDLESDPQEMENLAGRKTVHDIEKIMSDSILADWEPEELKQRVIASQRRRKYILSAESG
jgi:choline-sulfatase